MFDELLSYQTPDTTDVMSDVKGSKNAFIRW